MPSSPIFRTRAAWYTGDISDVVFTATTSAVHQAATARIQDDLYRMIMGRGYTPGWRMILEDRLPTSSTPGEGNMSTEVRLPEIGQIIAYRVNPNQEIDGESGYNRLFYVVDRDEDNRFKLHGLSSNCNTNSATYTGIQVMMADASLADIDFRFVDLDTAVKVNPAIKKFAERFDPSTYEPRVGDRVLVTRRHNEEEDYTCRWNNEGAMDYLIGSTHTIEFVTSDTVQLHNGWFVMRSVIQPVGVDDPKAALAKKARRNIATKLESWNSPHNFRSYDRKTSASNRVGKEISKLRAIAEAKNATETQAADYLAYVRSELFSSRDKVEPGITKTVSAFERDEWSEVGLVPNDPVQTLHCLHVSTEDKTKIAYYPTLRHFRDGREVRTTLGKYLTKYKDVFGLDENQIRDMAQKFLAIQNGEGYKLSFAEQDHPDEWVRIYANGPGSCMKGASSVKIYASGVSNLRLAYLEDVSGNIVARCIVRDPGDNDSEDVKGYIRVYPDPSGDPLGRRLKDMLTEAGYGNWTNTEGCLLSLEDNGYGNPMCPYLDVGNDGSQQVYQVNRNGRNYLCVGEGMDAATTSGYIDDEETHVCECCGTTVREDDARFVDSVHDWVCDECANGEDMVRTLYGFISVNEAVRLDVNDADDNEFAYKLDAVTLPDGRVVHEDVVESCWASDDPVLADDDGVVQVFVRVGISSQGGSITTHQYAGLKALAEHLDEWVVEFMPVFTGAKYVQSISCLTWKGQESPGSAVMSFRDLTYDMIRSDEVFEQIFEYLETEGYINVMEDAA